MFTGIVTDIGTVEVITKRDSDLSMTISTGLPFDTYMQGASVACSGVCLTVTKADTGHFVVDVSGETLSKTTLGMWKEGTKLNLESSLRLGDELGGHLVFGHVDGLAILRDLHEDGESWRLKFEVPQDLAHFFTPKGSVALDGISLTVNEVGANIFGVNIIPHTWTHTTLSSKKPGDKLNLEIDMLARYVGRMLEERA